MERVAGQHGGGHFPRRGGAAELGAGLHPGVDLYRAVVPVLTDRPSVVAPALSAGIIALVGVGWPYKLGRVTVALVGIAVGAWLDAQRDRISQRIDGI